MTQDQIVLLEKSFSLIAPISQSVAEIFYKRLFTIAPSLHSLFKEDMKEQGKKFMSIVAVAIKSLNRFSDVIPALQQLGKDLEQAGISHGHYDIAASALLWAFENSLYEKFTDDVRDAWVALYVQIATVMRDATTKTQQAA